MNDHQPLLPLYEQLPEEQRNALIAVGHDWVRILTEIAGPDAAESMWNLLADQIHPTLKHDLLIEMITGQSSGIVTLRHPGPNMISCIKVIRQYTALGLKESKDICDQARSGSPRQFRVKNWELRKGCVQDLLDIGAQAL